MELASSPESGASGSGKRIRSVSRPDLFPSGEFQPQLHGHCSVGSSTNKLRLGWLANNLIWSSNKVYSLCCMRSCLVDSIVSRPASDAELQLEEDEGPVLYFWGVILSDP